MKNFFQFPEISDVILKDGFWTPYVDGIRDIMMPYCFEKFDETGYIKNFISVANKDGEKHIGPPFSDGLFLESVTGACNFLNIHYDEKLDKMLDKFIDIIISAQQDDGYLCTIVTQDYPERKWGEGEKGDIVFQHDLYNQGTLIEAAVAHYKATKKTKLLKAAVKCANNICSCIGEKPKANIIPGHSLPEMAFISLHKLFRDNRELDNFAAENNVNIDEYLEIARFWYDSRGSHEKGQLSKLEWVDSEYNQDSAPLGKMRTAMGHAVRAGLCYQGAAAARRELERDDYEEALLAIWEDVIKKKIHISGGIGSRHDMEGFDGEYQLPNDAYLETCAGIALAFWSAEMNLISKKSEYFDYFELSLYNNILGSVGNDYKRYYYDNALVNDGTKNRWDWHKCPCCPPMLLKCYSSLATYVYSYNADEICVNMYLGSEFENESFAIEQNNKNFRINIKKGQKKASFRIPAYAEAYTLLLNGKKAEYSVENGYATIPLDEGIYELSISYTFKLAEIFANPKVEADIGRTCVMYGPYLMCAEGADNGGNVDFTLKENLTLGFENDCVKVQTAKGAEAILIPYYKRNNRVSDNQNDSKMAVWFKKENLDESIQSEKIKNDNLYGYYKIY
ncbi:MAG: glycoside hydrolase family 127 protein [Clostridia bacterium]|nr:glycoside hydrolase family 127 protein [Clostridia bacterium]